MEFRNIDELKESANRTEGCNTEADRSYVGCGSEPTEESSDFKNLPSLPKDGAVAQKPSDVRNGDLVSLLLAATPPYLYNIPLVPQTFFFSEMLKSFVQAKAERQNQKMQQAHGRRQRKRSWRESTPPHTAKYESRDKPLELTTAKQPDSEKSKIPEKPPPKKCSLDETEKSYRAGDVASSNFSVEKLANSSIPSGPGPYGESNAGDAGPAAPPLWYPLLYPPHPPYGIDPLHFFIDLRVSAHFWDRKLASDKIGHEETGTPFYSSQIGGPRNLSPPFGGARYESAFSVPTAATPRPPGPLATKPSSHSVHHIVSRLKNIYESLDRGEDSKRPEKKVEEEEEVAAEREGRDGEKKCKDLRALIGLELVVDYFKQENDKGEAKREGSSTGQDDHEFQPVSVE